MSDLQMECGKILGRSVGLDEFIYDVIAETFAELNRRTKALEERLNENDD